MTSHRRVNADDASVALPITPMLDMSFQLLFFFIATFHLPTGMEGQMPLALRAEKVDSGPRPAPTDTDLILRDDITITLKNDGAARNPDGVSTLTVLSKSGDASLPYSKDLTELRESLTETAARGNAPRSIRVRGDGKVKWRGVVKVMDACRRAGFEDITFAEGDDATR